MTQSAYNVIVLYSLDEHVHVLSKEVQLDFRRSMNRITFDRIVSDKPETYPFVTIPEKEAEVVPDRGTFCNFLSYFLEVFLYRLSSATWSTENPRSRKNKSKCQILAIL